MLNQYLIIALSPLLGAIVAGLLGRKIGRAGAHWVTILTVGISCVLSLDVLRRFLFDGLPTFNENIYTWLAVGDLEFHVGFLVDKLTAVMMAVVM